MTTLKLFAVANRIAEREGRHVVLRGAPPGVRRLLHLVPPALAMLPLEPPRRRPPPPEQTTGV